MIKKPYQKQYRILMVYRPTLSINQVINTIVLTRYYCVQSRRKWLFLWLPWKNVAGDFTSYEAADQYVDQQIEFEEKPIVVLNTFEFRSYR